LYIQNEILTFVVWNVLSYANIRNNLYILSIADEQGFCGKFYSYLLFSMEREEIKDKQGCFMI